MYHICGSGLFAVLVKRQYRLMRNVESDLCMAIWTRKLI